MEIFKKQLINHCEIIVLFVCLFCLINKTSLCDFAAPTAQPRLALLCFPKSRNAQVCVSFLYINQKNFNFVCLRQIMCVRTGNCCLEALDTFTWEHIYFCLLKYWQISLLENYRDRMLYTFSYQNFYKKIMTTSFIPSPPVLSFPPLEIIMNTNVLHTLSTLVCYHTVTLT